MRVEYKYQDHVFKPNLQRKNKYMFEEYSIVKLTEDLPQENLKSGDKGTIVMVYPKISETQEYEVEFSDSEGNSLAVLTISETLLEEVK